MGYLEPYTGTAWSYQILAIITKTSCLMLLPKESMPQHCCLQKILLKVPKSELVQARSQDIKGHGNSLTRAARCPVAPSHDNGHCSHPRQRHMG